MTVGRAGPGRRRLRGGGSRKETFLCARSPSVRANGAVFRLPSGPGVPPSVGTGKSRAAARAASRGPLRPAAAAAAAGNADARGGPGVGRGAPSRDAAGADPETLALSEPASPSPFLRVRFSEPAYPSPPLRVRLSESVRAWVPQGHPGTGTRRPAAAEGARRGLLVDSDGGAGAPASPRPAATRRRSPPPPPAQAHLLTRASPGAGRGGGDSQQVRLRVRRPRHGCRNKAALATLSTRICTVVFPSRTYGADRQDARGAARTRRARGTQIDGDPRRAAGVPAGCRAEGRGTEPIPPRGGGLGRQLGVLCLRIVAGSRE